MANLPLAYYVESYTRLPIRPSSVTLQTYCSELLAPYVCGEIDSLAHFGESSMAFLIQWTEFPSQLPFSGYNWLYSRLYCPSFEALHPQTASTFLSVRISFWVLWPLTIIYSSFWIRTIFFKFFYQSSNSLFSMASCIVVSIAGGRASS